MNMHFSLPLMTASALLLSGCFDDNNRHDDETAGFLRTNAGQYSAAYEQDGHAAQMRLALTSGSATLMLLDDRDQLTALSGDYAAGHLTFSNGVQCSLSDGSALCAGAGVELTLSSEVAAAPLLRDAAGDYQGADDMSLALSVAGEAQVSRGDCSLTLTLTAEDSGLVRVSQPAACGLSAAQGVVYAAGDGHDISALQLVLPGSELSGYWLR